MIYLDHAATTPVSEAVLHAMLPYYTDKFYNPSASYLQAKQVRAELQLAREEVARAIGTKPQEVYFVAGATEGNNLAIQGVLRAFPNCSVTISGVEHDSVRKTAEMYNCSVALVDQKGRLDMTSLADSMSDQTVLVSVMYANNEVGTVQPLSQIASVISQVREDRKARGIELPLYFHTDAAQAPNYLDIHVSRLGVDMMTLGGSKMYGPKQTGVLYVGSHVKLEPVLRGGGQERGLRSGTENVAGAVGFATALTEATDMRSAEQKRLTDLQRIAFARLTKVIPEATVHGSLRHRLPNNIHFSIPGVHNERLLLQLEQEGFLAAAGSACSASHDEPSHIMTAMGFDATTAQSSVRCTMGRSTTEADITAFIDTVARLVSQK